MADFREDESKGLYAGALDQAKHHVGLGIWAKFANFYKLLG